MTQTKFLIKKYYPKNLSNIKVSHLFFDNPPTPDGKSAIFLSQFSDTKKNNKYFYPKNVSLIDLSYVEESRFFKYSDNYYVKWTDLTSDIKDALFPDESKLNTLLNTNNTYLTRKIDLFYQSDYEIFEILRRILDLYSINEGVTKKASILVLDTPFKGEDFDYSFDPVALNSGTFKNLYDSNAILFLDLNFYDHSSLKMYFKKIVFIFCDETKFNKYQKSKKFLEKLDKALFFDNLETEFFLNNYCFPEKNHIQKFKSDKAFIVPENPSNVVLSKLKQFSKLNNQNSNLQKINQQIEKTNRLSLLVASEIKNLSYKISNYTTNISSDTQAIKKAEISIEDFTRRIENLKNQIIMFKERISESQELKQNLEKEHNEKIEIQNEYKTLIDKLKTELTKEVKDSLKVDLQVDSFKEKFINNNIRITNIYINKVRCVEENIDELLIAPNSSITRLEFNTLKNTALTLLVTDKDNIPASEIVTLNGPFQVILTNENGLVDVWVGAVDSSSVIYKNGNSFAPHPHTNWNNIYSIYTPSWKACLGEAEPYLRDAVKTKNIALIINILSSWLNNNRTNDAWSDAKRDLRLFINEDNKYLLEKQIAINDKNIDLLYIKSFTKDNENVVIIEKDKKYYSIKNETTLTKLSSLKEMKAEITKYVSNDYEENNLVSIYSIFYNKEKDLKTIEYYNELLETLLKEKQNETNF